MYLCRRRRESRLGVREPLYVAARTNRKKRAKEIAQTPGVPCPPALSHPVRDGEERMLARCLLCAALGLLAAAGAQGQGVPACDFRGIADMLSRIERNCCGDAGAEFGTVDCGLPDQCSAACAGSFLPFHDGACYSVIGLDEQQMETYDVFGDMCRCPPPCTCPRDLLQERIAAVAGACFQGGNRRLQSGSGAAGFFAERR
eukprot:SAG22_NODE_462_length_10207_cov_30.708647_4_plen_201_part_00